MLLVGIGRREKRIQKIFKKLKKRLDVTGIFGYNIFRPLREQISEHGELAEWSKAHDWKSCRRDERLQGSNP